MSREPEQQAPWGRCPRCGLPLIRKRLPLVSRPGGVFMEGPPTCPQCTPEEIERYVEQWGAPEGWGTADDAEGTASVDLPADEDDVPPDDGVLPPDEVFPPGDDRLPPQEGRPGSR